MITIKGITIDDFGDPSVGIFPSHFEIEGEMYFEDQAEYDLFKEKLREAFEYVVDTPVVSEFEDEEVNPYLLTGEELERCENASKNAY